MTVFNGFVKIHRKLLAWGWYQDNVVKGVFLHLLLTANFKDMPWQGRVIKRGQIVIGMQRMADELGFTRQQIRTAITKLKSTNEITTETTNKYTIVTIVNWEDYQVFDDESTNKITSALTNEQPTNNQQITNNQPTNNHNVRIKEIKNKRIKEIKEFCAEPARESVPDKTETREQTEHDFQILYDLYPKKRGRTEAFKRYLQWISPSGRLIAGKRCRLTNRQLYAAIKRYIDEQETAGKTDMQYWKNFDTLMGAQILDYVREGDSTKNELRS